MAMIKHPYELSIWKEKLNGENLKIEEKGAIIGAHDMTFLGKATNLSLTRKFNGTNTLTFQMPDSYYDYEKGQFVHNDLIDMLHTESKIKFSYKNRWYEFFIKKVDEKKYLNSYMVTFTCSDAFIDELSRNGYGITFDTELSNNVEEIGDFTDVTLDDSIWHYHPENNWGDFTEYKEEKLYRIPVSQFQAISGYQIDFSLEESQLDDIENKYGTKEVKNLFTGETRDIELSDDIARKHFWDQQQGESVINKLTKNFIENIPNDGYIYVPYSCLSFCYGSDKTPEDVTEDKPLSYDRAATEVALTKDDKLVIAPSSIDPRTIIQFYAFPENVVLEMDEAGVILNKEYSFFMTLNQWNKSIKADGWYIFEDTRLVYAEVLSSADFGKPTISHTFRYLKDSIASQESLGNKYVFYDGYLSDVNEKEIVKGKKFSIIDRSEINITKEINQYSIVYNSNADDFEEEYSNDDWDYRTQKYPETNKKYRVCSKIDTRQVIPQIARNLVQNGRDMKSIDGWAPIKYLLEDSQALSPSINLRGIVNNEDVATQIATSALQFTPSASKVASLYTLEDNAYASFADLVINHEGNKYYWHHTDTIDNTTHYEGIRRWTGNYAPGHDKDEANGADVSSLFSLLERIINSSSTALLWRIGDNFYFRKKAIVAGQTIPETYNEFSDWLTVAQSRIVGNQTEMQQAWIIYRDLNSTDKRKYLNSLAATIYQYIFTKGDDIYNAVVGSGSSPYGIKPNGQMQEETADEWGHIYYIVEEGKWEVFEKKCETYESGYSENYYNTKYKITATITKKIEDHNINGSGELSEGKTIVNFGIIGQKQTIKKDKIYCLGISGYVKDGDGKIKIKIGKGTLISEGNYALVDSQILDFNQFVFEQKDFNADLKDNLNITAPDVKFLLFKPNINIENPYFVFESANTTLIFKVYLFKAYTKGRDCFVNDSETQLIYKYSGRDLFWDTERAIPKNNYSYIVKENNELFNEKEMRSRIIFEDNIMLGTTYSYEKYYIQRLVATDAEGNETYYDTMGKKTFLSSNKDDFVEDELPLDAAIYTEDNYKIQTNYIDLNKCKFYVHDAGIDDYDCTCNGQHICFYQKFGYCPYRFQTEKHPRRVRTMSIQKSNRFNIIQTLSKIFEVYPQFYIEHQESGKVMTETINGSQQYQKKIFYITEKGKENKIGFRYEKNLKDISRTINSEQIVTKLYVLDTDSELSKTGLCSIKGAEDNPSKDSYIIDLSYYIAKGMLDKEEVEQDLYGLTPVDTTSNSQIPSGFLTQLGYYNQEYDRLTNNIINLQDASFNELNANVVVNLQGIVTAQEQILKIKGQLDKYIQVYKEKEIQDYKEQATYKNYITKISEQESILTQLIYSTFFTEGEYDESAFIRQDIFKPEGEESSPAFKFFDRIIDFDAAKKLWYEEHLYHNGILGQYNKEYQQIQQWKKERASYLKLINQISDTFYLKYEPYLKEGTWSDSNYLTDNAYYFGALDVAAEGAIPKVSYNISVVDISGQNKNYEEIYDFDLCDTTYVEDVGMFGINKITGLPNRLKTIISEVNEYPDDESKNNIKVQNFTTQFDDLFQQVTATVQSLTFNENIYKRSSNFTSLQNISNKSLQGALDSNDLVLLDTDEQNIQIDNEGTRGSDINNHANKYKLNGQGLFFSNDGGQHWSTGVGPSGINADYIKVGSLDAGKVRIADSNYVYFSWDKEGIVAYRDPQGINTNVNNASDAAIFNRYGLSIVQNDKIKLRAGYKYINISDGKISAEHEQSDEIGFYLYNEEGNVTFETANYGKGARLNLIGEMYISGTVTSTSGGGDEYRYKQGYKLTSHSDIYKVEDDWVKVTSALASTNLNVALTELSSVPATITVNSETYNVSSITTVASNAYGIYNDAYMYKEMQLKRYSFDDGHSDVIVASVSYGSDVFCSTGSTTTVTKDIFDTYISVKSQSLSFPLSKTSNKIYFSVTNNSDDIKHSIAQGAPYYVKRTLTTPYDDTDTYWTDVSIAYGGQGRDGDVALFLNNGKIDDTEHMDEISDTDRLFVSCKKDGNSLKNIFSILKGGQLYIGGDIVAGFNGKINELENQISIENAGIYIDAQTGMLTMDFDNIMGNDGSNLTDYIAAKISSATSSAAPKGHIHVIDYRNYYWREKEVIEGNESDSDNWFNLYVKIDGIEYPIYGVIKYPAYTKEEGASDGEWE